MSVNPNEYDVEVELGSGGFGIVFRVHNNANAREIYVIKEVNLTRLESKIDDSETAARVRDMALGEAKLMKSLDNKNIVKVYESGIDGNMFRMSMEYCDSGTLKKAIRAQRGQPFPEWQIRQWMAQLATALQYLHNKRILHRDIKSDNVFLTANKRLIKLGDFGIAKVTNTASPCATTMIGTYSYMAPELLSRQPYAFKAEVWALGVVIYELTALELPFSGDDLIALIDAIRNDPVLPLPTSFSVELRDLVVGKMLEKDVEKRLTMLEVIGQSFVLQTFAEISHQMLANSGDEEKNYSVPVVQRNVEDLLAVAEIGDTRAIIKMIAIATNQQLTDPETWKNARNNKDNDTPLHRAAMRDQFEAFKLLLPFLNDLVEWQNNEKLAAIHVAALNNSYRVAEFLIGKQKSQLKIKGGQYGRMPLHFAAEKGHLELAKMFVRLGADVRASSDSIEADHVPATYNRPVSNLADWSQPIHLAAFNGHIGVVEFLFSTDFQKNKAGNDGTSHPIHAAALGGHVDVVNYFLSGVDVELPEIDFGFRPLHLASKNGHFALVRMLVSQRGASIYAKTYKNDLESMSIHIAAYFGHLSIVEYFLEIKPDLIDAKDSQGNRPIHRAALGGQVAIVDYFISRKGVSVELRQDSYGWTPLHSAASQGHLELVKILVTKFKANVYAKSNSNDNEDMPIHLASWQGRLEVVKFFIETYPDLINVKNSAGRTPLQVAKIGSKMNEAPQVVAWLKSKNAK